MAASSRLARTVVLILASLLASRSVLSKIGEPWKEGMAEEPAETTRVSAQQPKDAALPTLYLIGERHSGTKWVTKELTDCFGHAVNVSNTLSRWKHWFQDDNLKQPAVVVYQVRNVYDWITAMQTFPHHAMDHFWLSWHEFVTKPWTMDHPPPIDPSFACRDDSPRVLPCHSPTFFWPYANQKTHIYYELQPDGTPYASIVDLRRDKILNHLSVAHFANVTWFSTVRYETLVQQGTSGLIRQLEQVLRVEAQCEPSVGRPLTRQALLNPHLIEWLNEHVDWEVERRLGYQKVHVDASYKVE